jgi:hypothetical protein
LGSKLQQFASSNNSKALNPVLRWDRGLSNVSGYNLYPDMIEIVAGPSTWPGMPTISYRNPINGDFEVQVKIVFGSSEPKLEGSAQGAGLMVRPVDDRLVLGDESFPLDWIVNIKAISDAGHGIGCRGFISDYPNDVAYLRIDRVGNSWRCAYSDNGEDWVWSEPKVDTPQLLDKAVEIALFAYSTNPDSVKALFQHLTLNIK